MADRSTEALAAAVGAALDGSVRAVARLGGGDVAESFRFELTDGRTVFAKTHRSPPPGFFTTEATGLNWLREPGVVAVPEVLAVSDGEHDTPPFLALEWIDESARSTPSGEVSFGRALARLHRSGFPVFGRPDGRTTGSRGLPNEPCDTWAEFYATQRLVPLRRLAGDRHALGGAALAQLDRVIDRLGELGVPAEPPTRLHGDLWAGNRLVDSHGRSWLIDPAAHGGHREFDLAMMQLFGGFGRECFEAYHDVHPLGAGWRDRIPLHQLAPLIVHAIKFGGGYAAATERALEATIRR
ncbi:MAG: phosphotransferase [Ilumatobacter sp.]|nr:phosphotransferase [Ilumatobacter sp.]